MDASERILKAKETFLSYSTNKKRIVIAGGVLLVILLFAIIGGKPGSSNSSLDDGFRGVPWGVERSKAAKEYSLRMTLMSNYLFVREGENNSLGDVPMVYILYSFDGPSNGPYYFAAVSLVFETKYFQRAAQELQKNFGNPTLEDHGYYEWDMKEVIIKIEQTREATSNILIVKKTDNMKAQKGGSL